MDMSWCLLTKTAAFVGRPVLVQLALYLGVQELGGW